MADLKAQDIVMVIRLCTRSIEDGEWTFATLGNELELSSSQVHSAFKRLSALHLIDGRLRQPIRRNVLELCIHGVRFIFATKIGEPRLGMLTAAAGPGMQSHIRTQSVYVWPAKGGGNLRKGLGLDPIHRSIPKVARKDEKFYAAFSAIDSLRTGTAREREVAVTVLEEAIRN